MASLFLEIRKLNIISHLFIHSLIYFITYHNLNLKTRPLINLMLFLNDCAFTSKRTKLQTTCPCELRLRNRAQKEEDGKTFLCDKRNRDITWRVHWDIHLTFPFSSLLSNNIIATLVTQGLPFSFLYPRVA